MSKTILKFSTEDCVPCKTVAKFFEDKAINHQNIDPFEQPDLAAKHRVRSTPTVIVLENDVILGRVVGANLQEIEKLIAS